VVDLDRFEADLGAAVRDVAEAEAQLVADEVDPVRVVEGVHLQPRDADEEAGTAESFLLLMIAQDVADVLAQEAFDALAELLDPGGLRLGELPVGALPRLERGDLVVAVEV